MKRLSYWGKNHPKKARLIIALSHILLVANAIVMGLLTYFSDYTIASIVPFVLCNIFFLAYLFYPRKKQSAGLFKYSYKKQKSLDFVLVISYGLVIAGAVNHFAFKADSIPLNESEAQLIVYKANPKINVKPEKNTKSELKRAFRKMKKNIKTELKALKKELKKQGKGSGNGLAKVLLILLTLGIALVLGALVAALSCNLSCSGDEGLAAVVLIFGWGAIIWLGIIAIKGILRMGRP